jgi:hypothetical protein
MESIIIYFLALFSAIISSPAIATHDSYNLPQIFNTERSAITILTEKYVPGLDPSIRASNQVSQA